MERLKSFISDWVALLFVTFTSVMITIMAFNQTNSQDRIAQYSPRPIQISIELHDSTNRENQKNLIDSLSTVLNEQISLELNSKLKTQEAMHQEFITREADRDRFITYVSGFLAVLFAIAGFFGFKSIRDIKERSIELAENSVERILPTKIQNESRDVLDNIQADLLKKTDLYIEEAFKNQEFEQAMTIEGIISDLEKLKERIEECCDSQDPIIYPESSDVSMEGANQSSTIFNDTQL